MILLEYNKTEIQKQLDIINQQNRSSKKLTLEDLEEADPTPEKKYVPLILYILKKSFFSNPTEFAVIRNDRRHLFNLLDIYHRAKLAKIIPSEWININKRLSSYSDWMKFENMIKEWYTELDYRAAKKEKNADKGSYKKIYEDNEFTYIEHFDETSACYFGRGTIWCTAATKSENLYKDYSVDYRIITLLPKNPVHPREKYQLDFPRLVTNSEGYLISKGNVLGKSSLLIYDYLDNIIYIGDLEEGRKGLLDSLTRFSIFNYLTEIKPKLIEQYSEYSAEEFAIALAKCSYGSVYIDPYVLLSSQFNEIQNLLKSNTKPMLTEDEFMFYLKNPVFASTVLENIHKLLFFANMFLVPSYFSHHQSIFEYIERSTIQKKDVVESVSGDAVPALLLWVYYNRPIAEYYNIITRPKYIYMLQGTHKAFYDLNEKVLGRSY